MKKRPTEAAQARRRSIIFEVNYRVLTADGEWLASGGLGNGVPVQVQKGSNLLVDAIMDYCTRNGLTAQVYRLEDWDHDLSDNFHGDRFYEIRISW